mgnify:CR=1 FL=1
MAIIALLLSMLIPLLSSAREAGYRAVCGNNLRQMSVGWNGYIQDHKETFPLAAALPEWNYGGVTFHGLDASPMLDSSRPINKYLAEVITPAGEESAQTRDVAKIFHCPSDGGVYLRGKERRGSHALSVLGQAGGQSCYQFYGNSYRANPNLFGFDSEKPGEDPRPLRVHDIMIDASRLLIAGDPAWHYATLDRASYEAQYDASWHSVPGSGHFLAADGSIRFVDFTKPIGNEFALSPRP